MVEPDEHRLNAERLRGEFSDLSIDFIIVSRSDHACCPFNTRIFENGFVGPIAVVDWIAGNSIVFDSLFLGFNQYYVFATVNVLVGERKSKSAAPDNNGFIDREAKPASDAASD
jgi:hypothetical protein